MSRGGARSLRHVRAAQLRARATKQAIIQMLLGTVFLVGRAVLRARAGPARAGEPGLDGGPAGAVDAGRGAGAADAGAAAAAAQFAWVWMAATAAWGLLSIVARGGPAAGLGWGRGGIGEIQADRAPS